MEDRIPPVALQANAPEETDLWEDDAPTMVLEDEDEVFDLGFIIENRSDDRAQIVSDSHPLLDIDTAAALETDSPVRLLEAPSPLDAATPAGQEDPLKQEVASVYARAEADEADFADDNRLSVDPDAEALSTVPVMDEGSRPDLDRDGAPERASLHGHAPGIALGFGASIAQDIGAGGFAIEENLLTVPPGKQESSIDLQPPNEGTEEILSSEEQGTGGELPAAGRLRGGMQGTTRQPSRGEESHMQRPESPSGNRRPGATKMNKQGLIEALNGDLAREYQAIIQYIQYSAQVKGLDRPQLAQFLRGEIPEELVHAQYLADKIVALGGVPTTVPAPVQECRDNMAMLKAVLEAEETAVREYRQRIQQADEVGEIGLRIQLENFLMDETNHKEEVEKLISSRG